MRTKFKYSDFAGKDPFPDWFLKFLRFLEFQFFSIKEAIAAPKWSEADAPPTCAAVDQRFHGKKKQVADADLFLSEGNADLIAPYTNSPVANTAFSLLNFITDNSISQLAVGSQFFVRYYNLQTGIWGTWQTSLASPLTTKGDIWVYGTGNTRLPVGSDYQVLSAYSGAATGLLWSNISSLPKEQFYPLDRSPSGLLPTIDPGDTNNDWNISVGWCWDDTFAKVMNLGSSLIKRLDASWSVGTNQGGLDTGSKAANTTYFIWIIMRSDTGVVDALFSTSSTSPTMPANYNYKRLIGIFKTNGSSNNIQVISSIQGNQINYRLTTIVNEVNVTNLGTSATSYTCANVPSYDGIMAELLVQALGSTGANYVIVTSLDQTDSTPSSTLYTNRFGSTFGSDVVLNTRLNGSAQFRARSDKTSTTLQVMLLSYLFSRSI